MNLKKLAGTGYVITLGAVAGMILFAGVFVAPVIFNANDFLGAEILTHYQSGIIMTQIFIKLNYILLFTALFVFLMEGNEFKEGNRDMFSLAFSFLIIANILLFVFYYTPFILEAQSLGAESTKTAAFDNMHKGSELGFKILLVAILGLLIRKFQLHSK